MSVKFEFEISAKFNNLFFNSINQIIRDHSNSTAVTFMYLPPPPNISMNFRTKCVNYLVSDIFM